MAEIFFSHSRRDKAIKEFFLTAFGQTKVSAILQEFESPLPKGPSAQEIQQNIQRSKALFVLLSENVEKLKHTRDWVNWECAVANNKEIWVFEPSESFGAITVVTPSATHYARYQRTDDWRAFIQSIVENYDDSHVLPTLSASAVGGALLNPKSPADGIAGGLVLGVGTLIFGALSRPRFGVPVLCYHCPATYTVVTPQLTFRCPVCNSQSVVGAPRS